MTYYEKLLAFLLSDKWQHFLGGVWMSLPFAALAMYLNQPVFIAATLAALVIGVGKEALDWYSNKYKGGSHGVELLDALATGLGGAYVGLLLSFVRN